MYNNYKHKFYTTIIQLETFIGLSFLVYKIFKTYWNKIQCVHPERHALGIFLAKLFHYQ